MSIRYDLPPGDAGPHEQTQEMTEWQKEHEPTLTVRAWLGTDTRFLVHLRWAPEISGIDDSFAKPLEEMLQTALGMMGQLYEVADAVATVQRLKKALDDAGAPN